MFGGKITRESLHRAYHNVKHHLGQAYHKTKHFLGNVDHGVHVAKKVYGVLAPVLDSYGGGHHNKNILKALGGHEHLRNKVMDTHETVSHNVNQVVGNIKKKVPELGL